MSGTRSVQNTTGAVRSGDNSLVHVQSNLSISQTKHLPLFYLIRSCYTTVPTFRPIRFLLGVVALLVGSDRRRINTVGSNHVPSVFVPPIPSLT